MNHSTFIIVAGLLLGFLSACRLHDLESNGKESIISESPSRDLNYVVLFAQGYNSCSQGYADPTSHFLQVFSDAQKYLDHRPEAPKIKVNVTYVESCFTGGAIQSGNNSTLNQNPGDGALHQNGNAETLNYTVTDPDGTISSINEGTPQGIGALTQGRASSLSRPGNPARVIMIGHSHGGWLVMNAANNWASGADLRSLVTIDPISYKMCSQLRVVYERVMDLSIPFSSYVMARDCKRAPIDLAPFGPQIRANIHGSWTNYYQTSFPPIQSSAIPEASSNINLPMTGGFAHKAILTDSRVWKDIDDMIMQDVRN